MIGADGRRSQKTCFQNKTNFDEENIEKSGRYTPIKCGDQIQYIKPKVHILTNMMNYMSLLKYDSQYPGYPFNTFWMI